MKRKQENISKFSYILINIDFFEIGHIFALRGVNRITPQYEVNVKYKKKFEIFLKFFWHSLSFHKVSTDNDALVKF